MSLPIPSLDDLEFQDLVEDAKNLIPIYDPDWTNFNPSDPGITILELLAWFCEMVLYRMDRITDEHQLKFLKLLGVELEADETLESGIRRAATQLTVRNRAITAADFEWLAVQGLTSISELVSRYPDLTYRTIGLVNRDLEYAAGEDRPGHVSIILILKSSNPDLLNEIAVINSEVKQYLNQRKLLTTRVHVVEPEYREVRMEVQVAAKNKALGSTVQNAIERYLDPVSGGDSGQGWPPGRKCYASDIYRLIEAIDGVDHVKTINLVSPDLKPHQLFKLYELKVEVEP